MSDSSSTLEIAIPDSLAGETTERLLYTMQMGRNSAYSWHGGDQVHSRGRPRSRRVN